MDQKKNKNEPKQKTKHTSKNEESSKGSDACPPSPTSHLKTGNQYFWFERNRTMSLYVWRQRNEEDL